MPSSRGGKQRDGAGSTDGAPGTWITRVTLASSAVRASGKSPRTSPRPARPPVSSRRPPSSAAAAHSGLNRRPRYRGRTLASDLGRRSTRFRLRKSPPRRRGDPHLAMDHVATVLALALAVPQPQDAFEARASNAPAWSPRGLAHAVPPYSIGAQFPLDRVRRRMTGLLSTLR